MKRFAFLSLAALLIPSAAAIPCINAQEPVLVDRIIARVNGDIITLSTYESSKAELLKELQDKKVAQDQINAQMTKLESGILQTLIDERLIAQKAQELGIEVEADVNKEWARLAASVNVPVEDFDKILEQNHMDPERGRESIRARIRRELLLNAEVYRPIYQGIKELEARDFYNQHVKEVSTPATVTLREIFISTSGRSPSEAERLAHEVLNQARGGADFATLVPKYTDAARPSRANGGLLGTLEMKEVGEAQAKVISGLKTGETTEPIKLADGLQILHLDEYKPEEAKPFESVKREVYNALTYDKGKNKVEEYLKKLRERAYIEVAEDYKHIYNTNANE